MRTIKNAYAGRLGPLPQMAGPLAGWTATMTFKKITDTISDFENVKTESDYPFEGVFEPMRAQEIFFKIEGQRAWKWVTLWTRTDYDISVGDDIEDKKGVTYRVLKKQDWGAAGYFQFDLCQDYVERPA